MPKISDRELTRMTVRIWKSDDDALRRMATADMPYNDLVRTIIHTYITNHQARMRAKIDSAPSTITDATSPEGGF